MVEYWARGFDDTTLKIVVEQVSFDVIKNTSDVRVKIFCKNHIREDWKALNVDTRYRYYYSGLLAVIQVDSDRFVYDTTEVGSAPTEMAKWFIYNNQTGLLYDKVLTVQHDTDGQKSIAISVEFQNVDRVVKTWRPATITHKISPIDRKAVFSITGNMIGSPVTVSITQQNKTLSHKIYWSFGNLSGIIAENATTSAIWTPSITQLAPQIPNLTSGRATIRIETYYGTNKIGEQNLEHVLNLPASVKPSLGGLTLFDGNQKVSALNLGANIFVQTQSNIRPRFDGVNGVNGSTVVSYRAELQRYVNGNWEATSLSTNANNDLMGNANFSGRARVVAYVTDSRGRMSDTRMVEVTYLAYHVPALSFKGDRVGSGNDRINVTRNIKIAPLTVNNRQKNTGRLTFDVVDTQTNQRTNNIGGSADWVGIAEHEKLNWPATLNGTYDVGKTYLVIGRLSDAFNSVSFEFRVGVEAVPVSISKFGLAVGKEWSRGVFEVGGSDNLPAYFDCDIYVREKLIQLHQLTGRDGQNINTGTHPDSITENGFYYLMNGPGRPNGKNGYLDVQRLGTDNKYVQQTYIDVTDGRVLVRVKNNNTWQPWKQLATTDMLGGQKHRLSADNGYSLAATGDWNNYKTVGFYHGNDLSNRPLNLTGTFYVIVHKVSDSYLVQEAISQDHGRRFHRSLQAGVWKEWREYVTMAAGSSWVSTGATGAQYKVVGSTVGLRINIDTVASTDFAIGRIPVTYLPIPNKESVFQLPNAELVVATNGDLRVRYVAKGERICTQITWLF